MIEAQIRALADEGLNESEIGVQLGLHAETVGLILRKESGDFTEDDCYRMADVIKGTAMHGENERNRLTAAMFVYEVKRGLRVSKNNTPAIDARQINQFILAAHQDVKNFLSQGNGQSDPATIGVAAHTQNSEDSAELFPAPRAPNPPRPPCPQGGEAPTFTKESYSPAQLELPL